MRKTTVYLILIVVLLANRVDAASCTDSTCFDIKNLPAFTRQTTWEHTFDFPDGYVATEVDVKISVTAFSDMRIHVFVSNERGFDPNDASHQLGWTFYERWQGGVIRKDFMTSEQIGWLNDGGDIYVHLLTTDESNRVMNYSVDIGIARMDVSLFCEIPGDFDKDNDVDGKDLKTQIADNTGLSLEDFAANFGKPDCSQTT